MTTLALSLMADTYSIVKWKPAAIVTLWPLLLPLTEPKTPASLFSLNITPTEASLVLPTQIIDNLQNQLEVETKEFPISREEGYAAFVVHGPLDFALVGILAALTTALAQQSISVFAVSTFDTDYILVKKEKIQETIKAWESISQFRVAVNQ
ncbi:UNVERIFIED_CONTAM: hypothetical protein HDU68_000995 [Siphonaria sp. JEL0065]|nr:hypothetical protein HDU68_000995 [Siphonaria sp. JEL0065]